MRKFEIACIDEITKNVMLELQSIGFERIREKPNHINNISAFINANSLDEINNIVKKLQDKFGYDIIQMKITPVIISI